jgi:hypothetical protein
MCFLQQQQNSNFRYVGDKNNLQSYSDKLKVREHLCFCFVKYMPHLKMFKAKLQILIRCIFLMCKNILYDEPFMRKRIKYGLKFA